MKIINECRINFKYKLSPEGYIISKTILSNMVSTQVIENTLKIRKDVNKRETNFFDILKYKITIWNISNFNVTNIFFQDSIPYGTRFIENSIIVNGIRKRCINPEEGFYIGDLSSGAKLTITFDVVVLPMCLKESIKNKSAIEYDYIYNIEEAPIRVNKNSNYVTTNCEDRLFIQISVANILKIHDCIGKIIDAKYDVKILKTKVINVVRGNLCTLVVIGKIEYKIWYKSGCYIKCIQGVWGFSTCMVVPIGINYGDKDKIKVKIECLSTDLINKNTIFINANLLLYY